MKLQNMQNQWWYRLLKVLYYSAYVLSLVFGFFMFPIVILFYEFIRGAFFYVATWDWNWQFQKRKDLIKKGLSYIQKPWTDGLARLPYNLIFFFIILPLQLLSISLAVSDFEDAMISGIILFVCNVIFFLSVSFYRFHNIGMSGKNIWWLIFPIINIIFLGQLIFKQGNPDRSKKYKNESLLLTMSVFILIIGGIIAFYIYQFKSLEQYSDEMRLQQNLEKYDS